MMVSSFSNAAQAIQHVAATQAATQRASQAPASGFDSPLIPPPRGSHSSSPAGSGIGESKAKAAASYAPGPQTVTVTVTMTVRDGQVDLVM